MDFKDKILRVRCDLNLSQEALAKELGVSFATVNRWEKGHARPSILFENKFNKYCFANNIKFEEKE